MEQENETITTYKGFDKDLKCRGFQYEIGKEYELSNGEPVSVYSNGFHACESPLEVLDYYFMDGYANLLRFCEVEQSGEFSKEVDSTKVASSKIKIKKEITFADLINLGVEWLKEKNSNDGGGNCTKIVSSSDDAKIGSSGDYAKIDSTGEDSVIMCAGHNSWAKAKKGSWITLAEWYIDEETIQMKPKYVKTEYVDGERIKEDTWYKLIDGEFVKVNS